MSPKKIHGTRSVTRGKALHSLNEVIGMICPFSVHKITMAQLNFSEKFEGYHVRLECGHITWTIQMWENCSFRRITRSWRHAMAAGGNNGLTDEGLTTESVWKGPECDELVKRHRLGRLRGPWWENRTTLSGEEENVLLANFVSQASTGVSGHSTYHPLPFCSFQCPSSTESSDQGSDTSSQAGSDLEDDTEYDIEEETMDEEADETQTSSQVGDDLEDETMSVEWNETQTSSQVGDDLGDETMSEEGDETQTSSQVGDDLGDETMSEEGDETQTSSEAGFNLGDETKYGIEEETMSEEGDETQD
ncbi:hypothetical protein HOY80DRAFT_1137201 [Tuber brumale]|nr:hypothetical protein HOY80DRAFT_1137201 [Tuber brumale]